VGALLLAAGCGKPTYTYIANKDAKTYFKVPTAWQKVDPQPIDFVFAEGVFGAQSEDSEIVQEFKRMSWSVLFTAPDVGADDSPHAYGLVTPMPVKFHDKLSFDGLRDLVLPVSDEARAALAQNSQLAAQSHFELLNDQVLTPDPGVHGVRVVYNTDLTSRLQYLVTYDLTAVTNNDSSLLYVLLVWCSTTCYRSNAVEINTIVTSFTVRSK
jgi:hypothetical protein